MWSTRTPLSNPKDRKRRKKVTPTKGNYCYSSKSPRHLTPKKNRQFNKQLKIYEKVKHAKNTHHTSTNLTA
jgi:hypothetical protein